jgi:hypothetical protein
MASDKAEALKLMGWEPFPKDASCHSAVFLCIGGSLANLKVGNIRGYTGSNVNLNKRLASKIDPFKDTPLAGRTVQCLTSWDCQGADSREFESSLFKFLHNYTTTHNLGEPIRRNTYVVGGVLDMRRSYDDNKSRRVPVEDSVLATEWAKNLFIKLEGLQAFYHGEVFYLGCGVPPDHRTMGDFIHFFHGKLMELVTKSNSRRVFPLIHYVDLYSPESRSSWVERSTTKVSWIEEPKDWITSFWATLKDFAIGQGVDSADRRHEREDSSNPPRRGSRGSYKQASPTKALTKAD